MTVLIVNGFDVYKDQLYDHINGIGGAVVS